MQRLIVQKIWDILAPAFTVLEIAEYLRQYTEALILYAGTEAFLQLFSNSSMLIRL